MCFTCVCKLENNFFVTMILSIFTSCKDVYILEVSIKSHSMLDFMLTFSFHLNFAVFLQV